LLLSRQRRRRATSEARWRALIDHTNDGVYMIRVEAADAGSAPCFRMEAANPAGAAIWNAHRAPDGLMGRDVADVLPGWALDQVLPHYQACLETGAPQRYDVVAPDGAFVREAIACRCATR